MKNKFFYSITLSILLIISFSIFSCKNDTTNPVYNNPTYDANSINGTISFVDTLFISDTTNGSYYVAAFASTAWPGPPASFSKIFPAKSNGKYTANYKLLVSANGNYYVSTAWIKTNPYASLILGIYDVAGKDTSRVDLLGTHPTANIVNGAGIGGINFNSYIDTTKKLAKF